MAGNADVPRIFLTMTAYLNIQQFQRSLLNEHPFSEAFQQRCQELGVTHIRQLIAIPREKAITSAYLGIPLFREWTAYLEKQHLLYLLR